MVHCCSGVTHLIMQRLVVWYNTPLFQRALHEMVNVQALHIGQGVLEHSPDPVDMSRMVRPSRFPDVFAARVRELNIYDILFESTTHMHDFITQFIRITSLALYNVAGTAYEHLPAERLHTLPSSLPHCTTVLWDPIPHGWANRWFNVLGEHTRTAALLLRLVPRGVTKLDITEMEYHPRVVPMLLGTWKTTLQILDLRLVSSKVEPWHQTEYEKVYSLGSFQKYRESYIAPKDQTLTVSLQHLKSISTASYHPYTPSTITVRRQHERTTMLSFLS